MPSPHRTYNPSSPLTTNKETLTTLQTTHQSLKHTLPPKKRLETLRNQQSNLNHEIFVLQHRLTQLNQIHRQTQFLTAEILTHRTYLPDIDTLETWAWRRDVIDDAVARYQGTLEQRQGAVFKHVERVSEVREMGKCRCGMGL